MLRDGREGKPVNYSMEEEREGRSRNRGRRKSKSLQSKPRKVSSKPQATLVETLTVRLISDQRGKVP